MDIGKQCRTRSDAAERGVWSGSALFAYKLYFTIWIKLKRTTQQPLNSELIDKGGQILWAHIINYNRFIWSSL